jgi:hypothetical protein
VQRRGRLHAAVDEYVELNELMDVAKIHALIALDYLHC